MDKIKIEVTAANKKAAEVIASHIQTVMDEYRIESTYVHPDGDKPSNGMSYSLVEGDELHALAGQIEVTVKVNTPDA